MLSCIIFMCVNQINQKIERLFILETNTTYYNEPY